MSDQQLEEVQDVLVADDDKDDFEVLSEVINNLSIKIFLSRAENGDVLMKLIHNKMPDLLLLDLMLPCKDGKDCIREIRSDKKFDSLPIIVYTSLRDLESIEFCYRWGTNLFVHKPQTFSEIGDVVRKIFSINWKKMRYYPTRSEFVLNPNGV
jgi:response regulator RpfG family c-di-GMP phosphodiesterase